MNNTDKFGKVAVLYGGFSAEREVSIVSGTNIHAALMRHGIDAHLFDPAQRALSELTTEKFDRCFLALHGRLGEDGAIQGALEVLGIPYTGSGVMASALCMDKIMTKRIWHAEGIPTPRWRMAGTVDDVKKALGELGSPMIVKAPHEGSTFGLSKVSELEECEAAFELAIKNEKMVLCEQFIKGVEFSCSILDTQEGAISLPLVEITPASELYDYESKYHSNKTQYCVPANRPSELTDAIREQSVKAYKALGCRGWARTDVMFDDVNNKFYLLEINTCTGMTTHSLFPMAAKAVGIEFDDLCMQILTGTIFDKR